MFIFFPGFFSGSSCTHQTVTIAVHDKMHLDALSVARTNWLVPMSNNWTLQFLVQNLSCRYNSLDEHTKFSLCKGCLVDIYEGSVSMYMFSLHIHIFYFHWNEWNSPELNVEHMLGCRLGMERIHEVVGFKARTDNKSQRSLLKTDCCTMCSTDMN